MTGGTSKTLDSPHVCQNKSREEPPINSKRPKQMIVALNARGTGLL